MEMKLMIFSAALSLFLAVAAVNNDLQHKTGDKFEGGLIRGPARSTTTRALEVEPHNKGAHKKRCKPTKCSTQFHSTTTETTLAWTKATTTTTETTTPTTTSTTPSTTTTETTKGTMYTRKGSSTTKSTSTTSTTTATGSGGATSGGRLSWQDIVHHLNLGRQFLKRAARMTGTLDKEDKKNLKLGAMERMSREILSYAETLSASLGTRTDSGTQRGSHLKSRPTCTVTSGYWDRECQCEFIPKPHRPHRPKPGHGDDGDDDDDEDFHHNHYHHTTTTTTTTPTTTTTRRPKPKGPPRPSYPWHHEHYYPRPVEFYYPVPVHYHPEYPYWPQEHHHHGHEEEQSVECILQEMHCLLTTYCGNATASTNGTKTLGPLTAQGGIRTGNHGDQASKSPALSLVGKLQAMLSNQTLTRHLESSGGLEMKLFLTHKMADLDKMAMDQLGQDGAKQPLLQQLLHSVIHKMESLN